MRQQKMITTRAGLMRLLVIIGVAAMLLVVNFSFPIANWWGTHVNIPGRPELGQLDVHIGLWASTGVAAAWISKTWVDSSRTIATLWLLFLVSLAIEWLQPHVTVRTFQWGDIVGNATGLLVAGLVVSRIRRAQASRSAC